MRRRVGRELRASRQAAGLSIRALSRVVRMSHDVVAQVEHGDFARLSLDRLTRLATTLGLDVSLTLHPTGSPVRDAGHIALLGRLAARLHAVLRMRFEVPMPTPGDLRNADGVIQGPGVQIMVEAETHVGDFQAVIRRARDKQRDLGGPRLILLLSDSRHHRRMLAEHPSLTADFPISARRCLAALRAGVDPGGDAIIRL
jgi:transcriptional regulator with XRE-family HTH domain